MQHGHPEKKDATVLAIAIEDRVDVCLWHAGRETVLSELISEKHDYFQQIYKLLDSSLRELTRQVCAQDNIDATSLFDRLAAIQVSIPGVIRDRRTLVQLPLWNIQGEGNRVRWQNNGVPIWDFDFPDVLFEIINNIIASDGGESPWRGGEEFSSIVQVANDTQACAAFEFWRRRDTKLKPDFIFVKIHAGVNAAAIQQDKKYKPQIKTPNSEAGHGLSIVHQYDYRAGFKGVCGHHAYCFEGMLSSHSFRQRIERSTPEGAPVFYAWRSKLEELTRIHGTGQKLDSNLARFVLTTPEGVELAGHYAGQLIYQLALGPLAPSQIVVGGRLSKESLLREVRKNVVNWSNGYPARHELSAEGINEFIVRSRVQDGDQRRIEALGALTLALSRTQSGAGGNANVIQLWAPKNFHSNE